MKSSDRVYFALWYRLEQINSYLIWYSDNYDGVLTGSKGRIMAFRKINDLLTYAEKADLYIEEEEPILHDLDLIKNWLQNPVNSKIECNSFLSAWNLFGDVAFSMSNITFDRDRQISNRVYEKLFWGNNLPSVTPLGKHYDPIWTDDEVKILQEVLADGLNIFRQSVAFELDA